MAIEHFSHKHLLVLNEGIENKDDDNSGRAEGFCYACWRPIIKEGGSAYYSCSESDPCEFFLHKTCAELPTEIIHPMHPEHSLTLFAVSPYESKSSGCDICRSVSRGFTYNCSVCEFDIEAECAFEDCSFRHQSHDHNLTLLQRPAIFHCDACLIIVPYAPFGFTKVVLLHPPLSNPLFIFILFGSIAIFGRRVSYYLAVLQYLQGEIESMQLALHVCWSHEDHPLILFENLQLQSKDGNEMKGSEGMLICDGCVKSIDAEEEPFYACIECSFFLHKICALAFCHLTQGASPRLITAIKTG